MQIGTQKNGRWRKCEMVDYLTMYSVAIQVNSFHNNMADKTVWQINQVRINEYSLHVKVHTYVHTCTHVHKYMYVHMQTNRENTLYY